VGVSTRTCYRVAVAAQLTLLVYFELCLLVPLGSWNKQPGMEKAFSLKSEVERCDCSFLGTWDRG